MNYWQIQASINAAIDRGVAVSHPGFPEWTFYVRPAHEWNYHYSRAAARIAVSRPEIVELFGKLVQPGYAPTAEDQALRAEVDLIAFAEGNLAGWEGVTDERGEEIDFTPQRAVVLLQHFRQIYLHLIAFAENRANFPQLAPAAKASLAEGNSKADCDSSSARGKSTGARSQSATNGDKGRPKR